jgi:hypothetical protein
MGRRSPILLLLLAGLAACPGPKPEKPPPPVERKPMESSTPVAPEPERHEVVLKASPRSGSARLLPEQAAAFDLSLKNQTSAPAEVLAIDGNMTTPLVRAFDSKGERLFEKSNGDMAEQIVGNMGPVVPPPPRTITLAPGEAEPLWVNLWNYSDPLKLGVYSFEAAHHLTAGAPLLVSNRVPFEIVPATVSSAALGYDSPVRMSSLLAWIAAPHDGKGPPRLLARLSGFGDHEKVQQGATDLGEAPPGARVAVSQVPSDGKPNWLGWIAVTSPRGVTLVRHNMTQLMATTGLLALSIADAKPLPRFPDRLHAVYLATGKGPSGPVLTGLVAPPNGPAGAPWTVPIGANPDLAVCAFGMSGPISVLLASDDGQSGRVSRIDVDESGTVIAAEQVVRNTPNRVVALTVDMRARAPQSFVILESNRTMPDRLALVRIPLAGAAPPIVPLAPLAGWPSAGEGAAQRALPAQAITMDVGLDGVPRAAITDDRGRLFGGPLDGTPLTMLSDGGGAKALFPHVVSLTTHVTTSCFTEQGFLFHIGGH